MSAKAYKFASRLLRANDMEYFKKFFRSYPDTIATFEKLDRQTRDKLDDRAYLAALRDAWL